MRAASGSSKAGWPEREISKWSSNHPPKRFVDTGKTRNTPVASQPAQEIRRHKSSGRHEFYRNLDSILESRKPLIFQQIPKWESAASAKFCTSGKRFFPSWHSLAARPSPKFCPGGQLPEVGLRRGSGTWNGPPDRDDGRLLRKWRTKN